jgi:hypothetical protein
MSKDKKPIKVKAPKTYTRAQAERIISHSMPDVAKNFLTHPNYHVRSKAFVRLGKQLPENQAEQDAILFGLQGRKKADCSPETVTEIVAKMRAKYFPPPPQFGMGALNPADHPDGLVGYEKMILTPVEDSLPKE